MKFASFALASLLLVPNAFAKRRGNDRSGSNDSDDSEDVRVRGNQQSYKGIVTVKNLAPEGGTCQTPVWVGIHDGSFDLYDRGEEASGELERIAEDGNAGPLREAFMEADGAVWDDVVGGAPICPGQSAFVAFPLTITRGNPLYFSYASMVLPSNDAFVANGNPTAHRIIEPNGRPELLDFVVTGAEVLDAGTEVNDELPDNTAFLGQSELDSGVEEDGDVELHPGFLTEGPGPILKLFPGGDFTLPGYEMMKIEVEVDDTDDNGNSLGYTGTITVTNEAPDEGTCQTPVWVGIHDGSFDIYNRGEAASPALERIAEDGNAGPLGEAFMAAAGTVWDGVVGGAPICPGGSASIDFSLTVTRGQPLYFSYASMVLPSNDAFVANGDPKAHLIFDNSGRPEDLDFDVMGSEVLDAGTEVNDEIASNTAFLEQEEPNTGEIENGVIELHPGFLKQPGNILTAFPGGDFTQPGYEMMSIEVMLYAMPDRRLRGNDN